MIEYSFTDSNGIITWHKGGAIHRENGPALIYPNGDKYWYVNDQLHRVDGPAIESKDGNEWWYKDEPIPVTSQEAFEKYLKLMVFR